MIDNLWVGQGRLTRDPEYRQTANGIPVCSFTIAVNRPKSKDKEDKADFITIIAWRGTADFVCKYFTKGSAIKIIGSIQTRSYDKNGSKTYVTEIVASEVGFAGAKRDNNNNGENHQQDNQEGHDGYQGGVDTSGGVF